MPHTSQLYLIIAMGFFFKGMGTEKALSVFITVSCLNSFYDLIDNDLYYNI